MVIFILNWFFTLFMSICHFNWSSISLIKLSSLFTLLHDALLIFFSFLILHLKISILMSSWSLTRFSMMLRILSRHFLTGASNASLFLSRSLNLFLNSWFLLSELTCELRSSQLSIVNCTLSFVTCLHHSHNSQASFFIQDFQIQPRKISLLSISSSSLCFALFFLIKSFSVSFSMAINFIWCSFTLISLIFNLNEKSFLSLLCLCCNTRVQSSISDPHLGHIQLWKGSCVLIFFSRGH